MSAFLSMLSATSSRRPTRRLGTVLEPCLLPEAVVVRAEVAVIRALVAFAPAEVAAVRANVVVLLAEVVWVAACAGEREDDDEAPPQPALMAAIVMTIVVWTIRMSVYSVSEAPRTPGLKAGPCRTKKSTDGSTPRLRAAAAVNFC